MKYVAMSWILVVLSLNGCIYDDPLAKKQDLPIDPSVLGHWEFVPTDPSKSSKPERMMVLKYSDTEYLLHYPTGEDGMYFRGYPIRVAGVAGVQIQWIGSSKGVIEEKDRKYQVVSYKTSGNEMVIRVLNRDLVDEDLKGTEALLEAFLRHKDHPELFTEPGTFRRLKRSN